ncbi:MauE/DoxX family redox-associated membrane protein [Brachybacterium alimentarium]|uniref:MauE/DoxX family redox-associated membrane protein n=1 Tax=Brachybacterium alimentarium TaxID=47845 RepID=UPI003FD42F3A
MTTLLITAPILLSLTLLFSGLAKLGARQGTEDAMTSLRIPLRSFHPSVASVLPVVEIVLALAVWIPFVPLQVMASVVIALLMLTYLLIIARALSWEETVECSCFGTLASPTVSRTTLIRNIVLSVLGVLGVIAAGSGLMTHTLVRQPLALLGLGTVLILAVLVTALAIGGTTPEADETAPAAEGAHDAQAAGGAATRAQFTDSDDVDGLPEEDELLDYERDRIPAGVLQRSDGSLMTLRQLASHRAALLVFVSEGCGPCERVLDQMPRWIEDLSPFLQVKAVLSRPVDQLRERTTGRVGEHALHDVQFSAREALGGRGAPSAVLLGADGLLAGGPVSGGSTVIEFVDEIWEQLQQAQAEGELPVAED